MCWSSCSWSCPSTTMSAYRVDHYKSATNVTPIYLIVFSAFLVILVSRLSLAWQHVLQTRRATAQPRHPQPRRRRIQPRRPTPDNPPSQSRRGPAAHGQRRAVQEPRAGLVHPHGVHHLATNVMWMNANGAERRLPRRQAGGRIERHTPGRVRLRYATGHGAGVAEDARGILGARGVLRVEMVVLTIGESQHPFVDEETLVVLRVPRGPV